MPRRTPQVEPATAAANTDLTPLELFALAKVPRNLDKLRPRLETADGQEVDFTVRISGHVNVAGEATSTSTERVGADQVLASVLAHISQRARKTLIEAVRGDFADYRTGGEPPELPEYCVDLADDLLTAGARETNKPKKGAVSAALAIELVKRN